MSNESRSNFETIDQIKSIKQVTECGWQFDYTTDRTSEIVGFKTNIDVAKLLDLCKEEHPTCTVDEFMDYCAIVAFSEYEKKNTFIKKYANNPNWYFSEDV